MTATGMRARHVADPPRNGVGPRTPEPWPYFSTEERSAVDRVLASGKVNYWTGDESRKFEEEYATYLGLDHSIALANGTLALELPLRRF